MDSKTFNCKDFTATNEDIALLKEHLNQNRIAFYVLELLAFSWRRALSFRNQTIDLLSKSMDWFLCDRDLRHQRVKEPMKKKFL